MADDKPDDTTASRGPGPDGGRARRPGPTIEVAATRVSDDAASKAGEEKATAATPTEPVAIKPPTQEPTTKSSSSVPPGGAKPIAGAGFGGAAASSASSATSAAAANSAKPDAKPTARPAEAAPRPGVSPVVAGTVGAISGAIAAAILFGVGASSGWLNSAPAERVTPAQPEVSSLDLAALSDRIARIEAQPAAAAGSAPVAPDPKTAERLERLETSIAGLRDQLATAQADGDAAKAAATAAASAVSNLQGSVESLRAAPAAAPVDLGAITARLGAIEKAAATLKTEAAQQRDKVLDDAPLRRVVAASMLDTAVRQGDPFVEPLQAMRPLVANADALKPLEPFASTGVPLRSKLLGDLRALLPGLTQAPVAASSNATWIERLQAGAQRLVRIRKTDGAATDAQVAAVDQIEAAAKRGDLDAARKAFDGLSAADQAKAKAWAEQVDARRSALAASQRLVTEASASLNKPAQ